METKGLFDKIVSGTKKFGAAAKQAGSSVTNNIGKSMSKVSETTKDIVSQSGEIGAKLAAVGAAVVGGIMNPLKGIVGLFALTLKYLTESEVRATATARATGLMGQNLREAQGTVAGLHERYRFFGESIDGSIQTIQGLNNAMGNVDYTTGAAADHITRFSIGAGIGKETSAKILSNFMLTQGATEQTAIQAQNFAKDLSNAAGVPINLVMDDLANISDDVSAYLGSNPEELVKATIEARRLGLSLESTAKVANSLLDFESSIEKEMEAQILTGKTLNYDKARQLALQGDTVGAAKDLLAQVGGIGEFNKMNVVQQKALADSVGMSVTEMKKALGTGEKEKDLEEERAEAMAKAQMDQAKGVRIIATTMESLNRLFHNLGKMLAQILMPYAKQFIDYIKDPENQKKIQAFVQEFVDFARDALPKVIDGVKWFLSLFSNDKAKEGQEQTSLLMSTIQGIGNAMGWVIEQAQNLFTNVGATMAGIIKIMIKNAGKIFSMLPKLGTKAIGNLTKAAVSAFKSFGKTVLKVFKKIPIIGALISFGFAVERFRAGDYWGAGAEIVSGLASFIPGVGTAVSTAIDVGLVVRDATMSDEDGMMEDSVPDEEDFISRGGKRFSFRKDDLVIGGTKLDAALGGTGSNEVVKALNVIAALLQQPGQVVMDGKKVGETIGMAKSYVDR